MAKQSRPVARQDSAKQKAEEMVSRLNGKEGLGSGLGGVGSTSEDFIARLARGGKVAGTSPGARATNEFVAALTKPSKAQSKSKVGKDDGPLAQKLAGKKQNQGKRNDGASIAGDLLDSLTDKSTAIRPKPKKDGHRGERLTDDQRSLTDGLSPDSFIGPQEPAV
jgi:hypothetical protein